MIKNNLQIMSSLHQEKIENTDLAKLEIAGKGFASTVVLKSISQDKATQWKVLAFNKDNTKSELILGDGGKKLKIKKLLPKIVGDTKHYPPANKEWKNSIYAYNKNSLRYMAALDKRAAKTIKSYFNLTTNRKLARSYRMRNLIRRSTSKRIFASKPEIKQTSNKVNITVYILNREGQFLLRKIYFYKKNMNINRDIYLHKIWLKKNLLAFRKTFKDKKSVRLLTKKKKLMTKRKNRNKTYIHNTIIKRYLNKSTMGMNSSNFTFVKGKVHKSFISPSKLPTLKKRYLLKSLRKRSLLKSLKKLKIFKDARPISVAVTSYNKLEQLSKAKAKGLYDFKTFENYLIQKKSKKLEVKIRNRTSTIKIKNRLSRYFFVKGKKGKGKKGKGRIRRKKRFKKIRLPYSNFKFKNEVKFFSFKLVSELKHIRKLFLFRFIKYLFTLLNIKIYLTNPKNSENDSPSFYLKYKGSASNVPKEITIRKISRKPRFSRDQRSFAFSYSKLNKLELLNLELLNFLKVILSAKSSAQALPLNNTTNFYALFEHYYKKYEKKYFIRYLGKYFKKEFLYINYFSKFMMNRFKFGKFLPGLKSLMNKIYSKKVKLNIVNLKYPYLNADIYADTITSKLRKKLSLLRVIRSSLRLAKLPSEYLSYDRQSESNKLSSLTVHKTLNVNDLSKKTNYGVKNKTKTSFDFTNKQLTKDPLDLVLTKLYPYSFVTPNMQWNDSKFMALPLKKINESLSRASTSTNPVKVSPPAKNLKILNTIRYKWVSGVRLEAAGRLTRRYTAARSVFKFRYKGSLKNIDYSQKLDISKRNASAVMLRNYAKSNSQYSFSKSKRRIGAFGLKAWIASY